MILGQEEKPPLDQLVHYGVLGMHWGVRKDRDPSTSHKPTRVDKKAARKNLRTQVSPVLDARMEQFFGSGMTNLEYSKLSTKKDTIRKGQEFARITTRKNETLRDKTYLAYRPEDRQIYRAVMPKMATGKSYEYTYEAVKKLSGPSEKERVDTFIKMLDQPSVNVGKRTMTGKEYLKKLGYGRDVKRLETQQLGQKYYSKVMATELMYGQPLGSAYVKRLSDKGYHMIADDNDRKILSHEPVIVLNPNGTVKRIGVRQLTKKEIVDAQKSFVVSTAKTNK